MLNSFYEAVLPRTGQLCLFLLGSKQHVWASSLDSLLDHTEARSEQQGVYFGTASFIAPTSRTQANVLALRSLRVDIDAGDKKFATNPEGAYPTQQDALKAFIGFTRTTKIAPSFVVSSGEGLHIYYVLDEDLAPTSWLPLATRLGELGAQHGLKIDTTCTTDTARILRPPGTLHPNGNRVTILKASGKVYSADEIAGLMGPSAITIAPAPARMFDMSVNADMAIPSAPKSLKKILKNCPAMAEVAGSKGDVSEPHWRAMLGIVKFTVEGIDAAHELSSGHPEYDPTDTEAKFNAWSTGPTSCKEFAKHTTVCATCSHNGKIKSPVMVGMMEQEQIAALPPEKQPVPTKAPPPTGDPWDNFIPPNFSVAVDGKTGELTLIYATQEKAKDATGASVMVPISVPFTHSVFWLQHFSEAEFDGDTALMSMCKWNIATKGVTVSTLPQKCVASQIDLLKELASRAVTLTTHTKAGKAMEDYVKAQLRRIQMLGRRLKVVGRFGLRIVPGGKLVCAQGKYVIYPNGEISESILDTGLRARCDEFPIAPLPPSSAGEWPASVWDDHIRPAAKKHAQFMIERYGSVGLRKYQLVTMLGLASPVMAFVTGSYHSGDKLPPNGLSVSLFSRGGGRGKTQLVNAVMLAFGTPSELAKSSDNGATTGIARIVKLSQAGTMPFVMDELGNAKESEIAPLISTVANGSGRERGTKDGGVTSAPQWALINLITTNRAQRDMVAASVPESNAIQYRLLEFDVNDVEVFEKPARDIYAAAWSEVQRDCAGALGAVLHYAICRMGVAKMNALTLACVAKASALINAKQEARFQYRALGAMLVVHTLLAQEGMVMFDLKGLVEEFRAAHDAGITFAAENILPSGGSELMQIMLYDLQPHTLITENETHRGHEKHKFDIPLNSRVPDVVKARHVVSEGWTYVSTLAMRDWCIEKKVSLREMTEDCKGAGILLPIHRNKPNNFSMTIDLFKGTKEETAVVSRCLKINTRKLRQITGTGSDDFDDADTSNVLPLTPKPKPESPDLGVLESAAF